MRTDQQMPHLRSLQATVGRHRALRHNPATTVLKVVDEPFATGQAVGPAVAGIDPEANGATMEAADV